MVLKFDVLKSLNEAGFTILEIYDPLNRQETLRYFNVMNFIQPSNNITDYTIEGQDITKVIQEDSLNVNQIDGRNRTTVILTKMAEIDVQNRRFSKNYAFMWYIK